jgi:hypothetical protein
MRSHRGQDAVASVTLRRECLDLLEQRLEWMDALLRGAAAAGRAERQAVRKGVQPFGRCGDPLANRGTHEQVILHAGFVEVQHLVQRAGDSYQLE